MTSSSPSRQLVRFRGWRKGLRTIDLMRLVRERTHVDLGEAKRLVELVVAGGPVALAFSSPEAAQAFLEAARETGAEVELESIEDGMA